MYDQVAPGGLQVGETAASNFVIISNNLARDPDLYLADRGLIVDILSHARGFRITEESLADRCRDGVKTVRGCIKRLMERGYLYRGERTRYPRGYRNKAGVDIGGALGPYVYYATDKIEVIRTILEQQERQMRARLEAEAAAQQGQPVVDPTEVVPPDEPAGQDYRPEGDLVDDVAAGSPVDNPSLTARKAGSPDQSKQGIPAGGDYRPSTTGVKGRTREDQPKKTKKEDQGPAAGGDAAGAPAALRLAGTGTSTATPVAGPDPDQTAQGDRRLSTARAKPAPVPPAPPRTRHRGPNWRQVRAQRSGGDDDRRQAARAELDAARSGSAVPPEEARDRVRRVATPPLPQAAPDGVDG